MVKRRRKKRHSFGKRPLEQKRRQPTDLIPVFQQALTLAQQGQADEALNLLTPLLDEHGDDADLHYAIGYAKVKAGDLWGAVNAFERALKLGGNPGYWMSVGAVYLDLGLTVHAIRAYRRLKQAALDDPTVKPALEKLPALEADIAKFAQKLGITPAQAEEGHYQMEEGVRAMDRGDFDAAIPSLRRAVRLLKDWLTARNHLSLSLFYVGQPARAIEIARRSLEDDPENVQALANLIRFLTWTGKESEADLLWSRLQGAQPEGYIDVWRKAEAAAVLEQDQAVYQLLQPWSDPESGGLTPPMAKLLGVAEANLGMGDAASHRLAPLRDFFPWIDDFLSALEEGLPGPGLATRYPYYAGGEMIPWRRLAEFNELVGSEGEMPVAVFQSKVRAFVEQYPQIVLVAEKLVWEEGFPDLGCNFLEVIGTHQAHDALFRFATSDAGDDDLRRAALFRLQGAGWEPPNDVVRIWQGGQWHEVLWQTVEIVDEYEVSYAPDVAESLSRGLEASYAGNEDEAEQLFLKAVELDPEAKEGYNNLAAIYMDQGRLDEVVVMLQRAIDANPYYVKARTNLASLLLDEEDIEGAKAILAPLAGAPQFTEEDMAFYAYMQARVHLAEDDYASARLLANTARFYDPDDEDIQSLLQHLDMREFLERARIGWKKTLEQSVKRDRAKRRKMQTQLTATSPSLDEALSLYTKDALTGVARVVIPQSGWTGLRKAELRALLVEKLQDSDNLERIVGDLSDDERQALADVLANGGALAWETFDERYGNDLEESIHWRHYAPSSTMGRLRVRGLLVEATVNDEVFVVIPTELRPLLTSLLG